MIQTSIISLYIEESVVQCACLGCIDPSNLNCDTMYLQVPTQAPTALPVALTITSAYLPSGGGFLISPYQDLQLYSPTNGSAYNWTSPNITALNPLTCLTAAGPYLTVPSTCLGVGLTYALRLRVQQGNLIGGSDRVRIIPCMHQSSLGFGIKASHFEGRNTYVTATIS